jgi:hypothetical protein
MDKDKDNPIITSGFHSVDKPQAIAMPLSYKNVIGRVSRMLLTSLLNGTQKALETTADGTEIQIYRVGRVIRIDIKGLV